MAIRIKKKQFLFQDLPVVRHAYTIIKIPDNVTTNAPEESPCETS